MADGWADTGQHRLRRVRPSVLRGAVLRARAGHLRVGDGGRGCRQRRRTDPQQPRHAPQPGNGGSYCAAVIRQVSREKAMKRRAIAPVRQRDRVGA